MFNKKQFEPKSITLEGGFNFRDLGGYPVGSGRRVAYGRVYRSGELSRLTPGDLAVLENLGIRTYIDFRDAYEHRTNPYLAAATAKHLYHIPMDTGSVLEAFSRDDLDENEADAFILRTYQLFAEKLIPAWRKFFTIMQDESTAPVVMHCLAGKDRTGGAAAMFLSALGVGRDLIVQDYLLTRKYLQNKFPILTKKQTTRLLLSVNRRYIEAMFAVIDRDFGGIVNYLDRCLGVDRKRLAELYTEKD